MPREIVNRDTVFQDDPVSRFGNAYKIEMYIENIEGFDGGGDLFTKFGVEIRDGATFVMARRRFVQHLSKQKGFNENQNYRPREGDLIYLPMSKTYFEITRVDTESPFYQLGQLPVFKMRCEMFEYNDEDFDTDIAEIDTIESNHAYQTVLTVPAGSYTFDINEELRQDNSSYTMGGEVVKWDAGELKLYVAHIGGIADSDGAYHTWTTTAAVVGQTNSSSFTPTGVNEQLDEAAQNDVFDVTADLFIDFSESNPFGDPS